MAKLWAEMLLSHMAWLAKCCGLAPALRFLVEAARFLCDARWREREVARARAFRQFARRYGRSLGLALAHPETLSARGLVVSSGVPENVPLELAFVKALEMAGYEPVVLASRSRWVKKYHRLGGVRRFVYWDQFTDPVDFPGAAERVNRLSSFEDLLALEEEGIRVGRFAASTALRVLRVGHLDLASAPSREAVVRRLAWARAYAGAARRLIGDLHPDLVMMVDRGYSPQGELFDECLKRGVSCAIWTAAHKSNALMLKRYSLENRDDHHCSLAADTWEWVRRLDLSEADVEGLRRELYQTYASGDWYGEVGTQFGKSIVSRQDVERALGLDSEKKTAVIFPHILWDGTFFWGVDLFGSYEEWLVETVRAACRNPAVNWVIKIHPANVVKDARDGVRGEPSEVIALRRRVGPLPPHVFVIPAESPISTYSLFNVMDYCLTVRGTIGIEAASFGIPVLTAGTGRYDRKGFTVDSANRASCLSKLASIQDIPPLSEAQRRSAERFAFAVFLLRPLLLTTITHAYRKDARATPETRVRALTREDWLAAPDLKLLAAWLADRRQVDFLMPIPDSLAESEVA